MTLSFYEHHQGQEVWGEIILDRPNALNAINDLMSQRLYYALETWLIKPDITKIIIRSSGNDFCSGADLATLASQKQVQPGAKDDYILRQYKIINMIRLAKKPIWVFASGATLGFGAGLFMAASHRVCDPSFYLSMPECGIGFFPDVGACKFMLEFANFSEVFWHGMTLRVQDLISRHLLYAVVKNSDFNAYLSDMSPILPDIRVPAKTVAVNVAPISRYYNEMLLGVAAKLGYQELAVYEYALARFMLMEPDFTEGISAFFDKRKPNWQISYKRQELIDMVRKIPDNILKAFYD